MAPTSVPVMPDIAAATTPIINETRVPCIMRENMSRPRWSVPSKYCELGLSNASSKNSVGEYGAITSANIAISIMSISKHSPIIA